jgi:lipoprotein signal peptidase
MRYTMTIACTLIGVALSLFNSSGYDPHNLFLLMFSVPMWFVEVFTDIHRVNIWFMYVLTVISWAAIGYVGDRIISRTRVNRYS